MLVPRKIQWALLLFLDQEDEVVRAAVRLPDSSPVSPPLPNLDSNHPARGRIEFQVRIEGSVPNACVEGFVS